MAHLGAFLAVSAIVIVTPGPDTLLTVRNALFGGRRSGIFTAAGVSTGQAAWALAASTGVAALLQASAPAFLAVRLAGASYLAYLGWHALVRAVRGRPDDAPASLRRRVGPSAATAYRQGLLSNLGNPKMAVFFVSLLPQFTTGGAASFAALFSLGLVFCTLTLVWLTAYAVVVARAGSFFRHPLVSRVVDAVAGAVLLALGVRVATERS